MYYNDRDGLVSFTMIHGLSIYIEIPKVALKLLCILNTDSMSNEMFSVSIDANVIDLQKKLSRTN